MQTTTQTFTNLAKGQVRPISFKNKIAFDKVPNPDIKYFTLDDSLLDSQDILAFEGGLLQLWDRYQYSDYSTRVISQEVTREQDPLTPIVQSIASFEMENVDGYFTAFGGSPINDYLIPKRPVRLFGGFGNSVVPLFAGLTNGAPKAEYNDRTANFDAMDFLSYVFAQEVGQAVILQDKRTDEIIDVILQAIGLESSQYVLDEGYNTVAFCYFEPDRLVGGILKQLVQAEFGKMYLTESGVIRFENRATLNTSKVPVYEFQDSDIVSIKNSDDDKIINAVEILSSVRKVLNTQIVFSYSQDDENPVFINAGSSATFFFNLDDPVVDIEAITGFLFNQNKDGSGTNTTAFMTVTDTYLFATAVRVTFSNSGGNISYLQQLVINGRPAKVVNEIKHISSNAESIDAYGVKKITIENNFIQSLAEANDYASFILLFYAQYGSEAVVEVKGNPALQVNDFIHILSGVRGQDRYYIIDKIVDIYSDYQHKQVLTLRSSPITNPFILDVSLLDSTDQLGF